MKKTIVYKLLFTLLICLLNVSLLPGQTPAKWSFQAVIRNGENTLVANSPIGMRITIFQGSDEGTAVYVETQQVESNDNGLVSLEVGAGNVLTGQLDEIDWSDGPYFMKTETDPEGGTDYTISGTYQLLSVPYALHAKTAENITGEIAETDPVFQASPAAIITNGNLANWDNAFGWGNHAMAGYLTSLNETDPLFSASPSFQINGSHIANWNMAYGWGNHAAAGYLTGFNEVDPLFSASAAFQITSTHLANWNNAFGWGNHATAGYLTNFVETDPLFAASPTSQINATQINNWNTAFGWGNHSLAGYLTSFTETDPVFLASPAYGINNTNISHWNTAYNWGNHSLAGYLTSFTETDPLFSASVAHNITAANVSDWNTAYGWGDHADAGYLTAEVDGSITNEIQTLSISNDTIYLSDGGFVKIPPQNSIPALITKDDFSYAAPFKNFWSISTTGGGTVTLGNSSAILSTNGGGNSARLYSNRQRSVNDGKLVFTAVLYTYEDNNTAYGPLSRGLVSGTNRSNAIEFVNVSGSVIQARTVAGGVATTTNYSVGASVANNYCYTIIATKTRVDFYFNGILVASHTTNIPTTPLNMYFDASTYMGNVPQVVDDAQFEIIPY